MRIDELWKPHDQKYSDFFMDIMKKYPKYKAKDASKNFYQTLKFWLSSGGNQPEDLEICGWNNAYGREVIYYKLKDSKRQQELVDLASKARNNK